MSENEEILDAYDEAPDAAEDDSKAPSVPIETREFTGFQQGSGEQPFSARGYSYLKTVEVDGAGQEKVIRWRVPIKCLTSKAAEGLLKDQEPVPPKTRRPAERGSQLARDAGLPNGGVVLIADFTDKVYQERFRVWTARRGWAVLAACLDIPLKTRSGELATTIEQRIEVVQEMGFSDTHIAQIVNDARHLTQVRDEEMADFFDGPSVSKSGEDA